MFEPSGQEIQEMENDNKEPLLRMFENHKRKQNMEKGNNKNANFYPI
jgi:hypothetical protein